MNPAESPLAPKKAVRVNLRTPEVMSAVQAKVEHHYHSSLVEQLKANGGVLSVGATTIRIARQFGFCYGVERAIDLAYAARKVFPDQTIYILGEIIHNPEVNGQLAEMGIRNLLAADSPPISELDERSVVIIPAFGAETQMMNRLKERGVQIVDTTCGDVMSVWKRVRQNAREDVTSIIHGKANHEETRATASRALGEGNGHYLIILNLEEADYVCRYIRQSGSRDEFLAKFAGAYSEGFDPERHLLRIGVANQTTMLRSETEEVQRRLRQAVEDRDETPGNFRFFDTICGATQERQDALFTLLEAPLDVLLVVGGYNSSNTTHLAEIGEKTVPTYFVRNAKCLHSPELIEFFNFHRKQEETAKDWLPLNGPISVGITAGASCPNSVIEEVIRRVLTLRNEKPLP